MYWIRTIRLAVVFYATMFLAIPAWADPADDQYTLAAGYYSQSRWQAAYDEFRAFLDKYPNHDRANFATFFMGESLVQQNKYDEARQVFAKFLEQHPTHRYARLALFRSGEMAYLKGQDGPARQLLDRFYKSYPTDPFSAYVLPYLGEIALRGDDAAGAVTYYRESISKFSQGPLTSKCRFGLAQALEKQGKDQEAEQLYGYLSENNKSELADDALLQHGLLLYNRRRYKDAVPTLQRFESTFAESKLRTQARYWLGMTHLALNDSNSAATILVQAAKDDPDHKLAAAIHFSAGEALRQSGKASEAQSHYQRVVDQWSNSEWGDDSLQTLVRLAFEANDHELLDTLAGDFGRRFPKSTLSSSVRQMVGRSLLKRERFDEATAEFEKLTQQVVDNDSPDAPTLHYLLALAHLGNHRYVQALSSLDHVKPGGNERELAAGTHMARATALIGIKSYARAVESHRKYLSLSPTGADAAKCRAELAISLAQLQKFEEAAAELESLRIDYPRHPLILPTTHFLAESAHAKNQSAAAEPLYRELTRDGNPREYIDKGLFGLAWLKSDAGQFEEAVNTLARLIQESPDSSLAAEAEFMRAKALKSLGQIEEAKTAFQHVIDRYPNSKQLPDAILMLAQLCATGDDADAKQTSADLFQRLVSQKSDLPNLDAVLYQLAWVSRELDRGADAEAAFTRLNKEFPESRFWGDATYRLAEQAAGNKDNKRAAALIAELLQSKVQGDILCHALYLNGQLAASNGDWKSVGESMKRLTDEFPSSSLRLPADYWLAEALYRQGDYEKAKDRFATLAEQTSDQNQSWIAMVPLRRAQILAQQKNWTEAFELASSIAERFPQFRQQYEVDYLLGRCLASRAQFADSRDAYERVVRSPVGGRTETACMAQWMIGESFFHQKNYESAIKAYHRVESLYAFPKWQAAALLQAGKCYEQKRDWQTAIKLYAQLLKNYPETSSHEEASRRLRSAVEMTPTTDASIKNK